MHRQHPFLSPTGLVFTAVVLAILGVVYLRSGGQMFSPGPLAAVHADLEDCADCHQPLKTTQGELCMDCHTEMRDQLKNADGLHAFLEAPNQCRACHPDHRGADFDPRRFALTGFDHALAQFSLAKHTMRYDETPMECTDCHLGEDFIPEPAACQDCHAAADEPFMQEHAAAFGPACFDCHDGADWMENFSHDTTDFPLLSEHVSLTCAACHTADNFAHLTAAPAQCADCHTEPSIHAGLFASTCEDCHTPSGWSPATLDGTAFDHFTQTGFSLVRHAQNFDGTLLNCSACHTDNLNTVSMNTCLACHTPPAPEFMAQHTAEFGTACLDCHDGVDRMENFDHAALFMLDGAHASLDCTACHADHAFAGTPTACAGCHAEPEIHAGLFGLDCANCHATAAWRPAALTFHQFPLDHGGQGEIACATCHPVSFILYTCDTCHAPAEMTEQHDKEDIFNVLGRCTECHATGLKEAGDD